MKNIPFPQANNIELIFKILMDIDNDGLSKIDVSTKYIINERQGSYYLDALMFLSFVEKINTKYFLTEKGVKVKLVSENKMKSEFIIEILKHEFINTTYEETKKMNKKERISYISSKLSNKYDISLNTAYRRAGSLVSWFEWFDTMLTD